ncbi:MAG: PEP-CTERM sorting domain-containing protein [Planctomycetota bacterium]|nr:PEP-CTERM sorting domain-containing protein [Planctomycetota bacterium]
MKTIGAIVVLLVTAVSAEAAITASSVKLQINTVTGQAYLVSTVADTIPLVGYYIRNATGKSTMIPDTGTFDMSHWVGIGNYVANGHASDLAAAGLSLPDQWFKLTNTASYLGEAQYPGYTSHLAGYASIPIGHITTSAVQSDFSATGAFKWQYDDGSTHTMTNNAIEFVPEPAALGLIALGGLAALRRRR